jgi:hypothetical protein
MAAGTTCAPKLTVAGRTRGSGTFGGVVDEAGVGRSNACERTAFDPNISAGSGESDQRQGNLLHGIIPSAVEIAIHCIACVG